MEVSTYDKFLTRVIDEGIEAAKADYSGVTPGSRQKRGGSVAGFEACRGKHPADLRALLEESSQRTHRARMEHQREASFTPPSDYWYHRCYEAEVEWVCNCVSALLQMLNKPVICDVTYRGLRKALSIINPELIAQFDQERIALNLPDPSELH